MRFSASALATATVAGLLLTGCASHAVPAATTASPALQAHTSHPIAGSTRSAPPSPVSTAATLVSKCTTGVEDQTASVFYPVSAFLTPGTKIPSGDSSTGAYRVTLTNNSGSTAEVTGFAVVFYDGSGSETSSDSEGGFDSFITSGQSLTWTEAPWGDTVQSAPFAAGQTGAIDVQSSCQVVKWTQP
jgi:hypothetical protein